tara:strand:- start:5 stop:856 length:852 start_codon:yes stop_codon:yes gene_type:complete
MSGGCYKKIDVGGFTISNDKPFVLIAGPCQIESEDHSLFIAEKLAEICSKLNIPFIFKASYDKANRTSVSGQRGVGLEKGIEILAKIKTDIGCPVLTDVHEREQCKLVSKVVDLIQIPAFLCRQTDLILEAGKTGKIVNIKKGQFLAPWDMGNIVEKLSSVGNYNVLLTERGTSFGYNTLVCDMRSLTQMADTGCPIVFDATHSVQRPGALGGASGGDRSFVPVLARAAIAVGIASLFIETHDEPDKAPSDGQNMLRLDDMEQVLSQLKKIDEVTKANLYGKS